MFLKVVLMVPPPMIPQLAFQQTSQQSCRNIPSSWSIVIVFLLKIGSRNTSALGLSQSTFSHSLGPLLHLGIYFISNTGALKRIRMWKKNHNIHQELKQHCLIKIAAVMKMFFVYMLSRMIATSYMWLFSTSNVTSATKELIF